MENETGIYNTVAVLADLSPSALASQPTLAAFLEKASENGLKTGRLVTRVRDAQR